MRTPPDLTTRIRDYALILVGCLVQAIAMDVFLIPAQLAAGGVSGLAQIINALTGWPVGTLVRGKTVMWEGEIVTPGQGQPVLFSEALPG